MRDILTLNLCTCVCTMLPLYLRHTAIICTCTVTSMTSVTWCDLWPLCPSCPCPPPSSGPHFDLGFLANSACSAAVRTGSSVTLTPSSRPAHAWCSRSDSQPDGWSCEQNKQQKHNDNKLKKFRIIGLFSNSFSACCNYWSTLLELNHHESVHNLSKDK